MEKTRNFSAENEKNISVKKAQTPSSAKSSKVGADATDDEGMELIRFWAEKKYYRINCKVFSNGHFMIRD